MTLRVLILAVMASLAHHAPTREQVTIAEAIDAAVQADAEGPPVSGSHGEDAVLLTLYAWHESRFREHPRPVSWDSHAHRSCGVWQMQCPLVERSTLTAQASEWLRRAHAAGLADVDSSPRRAALRELDARGRLSTALGLE